MSPFCCAVGPSDGHPSRRQRHEITQTRCSIVVRRMISPSGSSLMDLFCCSQQQLIKLPVIIDGGGGAGAKNQTYTQSAHRTSTYRHVLINIDVKLTTFLLIFLCQGIFVPWLYNPTRLSSNAHSLCSYAGENIFLSK